MIGSHICRVSYQLTDIYMLMTHVIEENVYDDYDTLALSITTITAFLSPHGSPKYATILFLTSFIQKINLEEKNTLVWQHQKLVL